MKIRIQLLALLMLGSSLALTVPASAREEMTVAQKEARVTEIQQRVEEIAEGEDGDDERRNDEQRVPLRFGENDRGDDAGDGEKRAVGDGLQAEPLSEDVLDIPAFLRRQAD